MPFREFYVRGEGKEKTHNSSRSRPQLLLANPIRINKFNVKSAEIPLTIQPKVFNNAYSFYTKYTFNTGATLQFRDELVFTDAEILDGPTLLSKMQSWLEFHADDTKGNVVLFYNDQDVIITGTVPNAIHLGVAPTAVVLSSTALRGVPKFSFDKTLAVTSGGVNSLSRVDINLVDQSLLASFFDFPYYGTAMIAVHTSASTKWTSSESLPTMRTRPSYILLHSNIRGGAQYLSTGRAYQSDGNNTIIAKITIPFTSEGFGDTVVTWNNPCVHPDLMYSANDAEYSYLEFWCTYPDGTEIDFNENSFSLTLMTIVY